MDSVSISTMYKLSCVTPLIRIHTKRKARTDKHRDVAVFYNTFEGSGLSENSDFGLPFWYSFATLSGPKGILNGTSRIASK